MSANVRGRQRTASLSEIQRKELKGDELRRKGLRRGDADLRSRVRVHGSRGLTGGHASHNVADRDAASPLLARLAERRERVRGLAGLRHDDRELFSRHDRVPVPVLRGVIDLNGYLRERLNQILSDERCVPGRAAGENRDLLECAERVVGDVEILEEDSASIQRHPSQNRVPSCCRLLVDLLEHEVLVAGLFGRDGIPQHTLRRLRDGSPGVVGKRHPGAGDDRHLLVAEEHHVPGMREDRRDV